MGVQITPQFPPPYRRPAMPAGGPLRTPAVAPPSAPAGPMPFQSQGAAINPEMIAMLEQLMQQLKGGAASAPAAVAQPAPAQPAAQPGVHPAAFAQPVEAPEEEGGLWDWLTKAFAGNSGNNQRLALDRMISGNRSA